MQLSSEFLDNEAKLEPQHRLWPRAKDANEKQVLDLRSTYGLLF